MLVVLCVFSFFSYFRVLLGFARCLCLCFFMFGAATLGPGGPVFFFSGVGGADSRVLSSEVFVFAFEDVEKDDDLLCLEVTDSVSM